ncbi:MAG TPA: hypothetical protein VG710_17920 [Opitutus sp.]|nr:hypothetical protein [Opitutus sp.]
MLKILSALLQSVRELNPVVTLMSSGFTFAVAMIGFFNALWTALLARIATVSVGPISGSLVVDGLAFMNYFFPVQELFVYMTAYASLYVVCSAIRIIKSFIPTIS